ncbi:glycosyltransferase family 2 protein, partial [Rhodococcus hoagii]|nr:glycosyltransferase family 2 protein [Prescottella equi]
MDGSTAAVRSALHEHPASGRLVVQRGVFTGPTPRVKDELYASITSGSAHRERLELRLDKGAVVDTDTYFGRFAASY